MKTCLIKIMVASAVLALITLNLQLSTAFAQGTAFAYQGRLNDGANPANGSYDLTFTLYDTNQPVNNLIAGPLTNSATLVTNGLFTVTLDFGNPFDGTPRWLEIGVRTNGIGAAFTTLAPRQQITPSPYAITAGNVIGLRVAPSTTDAPNLIGGASVNVVDAGVKGAVIAGGGTTNYFNTSSSNRVSADFSSIGGGSGNDVQAGADHAAIGGGLANIIGSGAHYSVVAGGWANSILNPYSFIGGGNINVVNGNYSAIGGGYQNHASSDYVSIGGGEGNTGSSLAATVGGGDANTASGGYSTVSGGAQNFATAVNATVGGGQDNTSSGYDSAVGGGQYNTASGDYSTVAGGWNNRANNAFATVPGGEYNLASGQKSFAAGLQAQATNDGAFVWADSQGTPFTSTNNDSFNVRAQGGVRFVTGGAGLTVDGQPVLSGIIAAANLPNGLGGEYNQVTGSDAVIAGGNGNTISGAGNAIVGGEGNAILQNAYDSFIGGGLNNTNSGNVYSFIGGGAGNTIQPNNVHSVLAGGDGNSIYPYASSSFLGGGDLNSIQKEAYNSVLGGGENNVIQQYADHSVLAGGLDNVIQQEANFSFIGSGDANVIQNYAYNSFIGGGEWNAISANAFYAFIGGGQYNTNSGPYASIVGGYKNLASGQFSFAAGQQAQATNDGAFVWADSQPVNFNSTGTNQFLIRASGGVGINTNNPGGAALNVNGAVTATSLSGNGAVPWQVFALPIIGHAQPNHGYLFMNNVASTITLPVSANVGDEVRVFGTGANGWKIAQNAGQSIALGNFPGQVGANWQLRTICNEREQIGGVATSADGTKLFAIGNVPVLGNYVHSSADSGATWTTSLVSSTGSLLRVACSADGTKVVVAGDALFTSTDSGVTWIPNSFSLNADEITSLVSSSDGTKLALTDAAGVYVSIDSGATWTQTENTADQVTTFYSVAISADGTKLVAVGTANNYPYTTQGPIITSSDSGTTWTKQNGTPVAAWNSVTSSADGTKLVAVSNVDSSGSFSIIATSGDSGVTWTTRLTLPQQPTSIRTSVVSSADGSKLVAIATGDSIPDISQDSGVTWALATSSPQLVTIASSSDGTKLVGAFTDSIYTSVSQSTTGSAGYVTGVNNASIDLIYVGNGQYVPINYNGTIRAY